MFAEEAEWNDDPEAKALTEAVIHGTGRLDSNCTKTKMCRKRSLLQTLNTLGSVPSWTDGTAPEGSEDSETEAASVPGKRRKKRHKKPRRRTASERDSVSESKQVGEEEACGTEVTKGKGEKKSKGSSAVKKAKPENEGDREDFQPKTEKSQSGGNEQGRLSRQQWRNKMKNKRKSKNKYRRNGEELQGVLKADVNGLVEEGGKRDFLNHKEGVAVKKSKGKPKKHANGKIQLSDQHTGVTEVNAQSVGHDATEKEQKNGQKAGFSGESEVVIEASCETSRSEETAPPRKRGEKKNAEHKSKFEFRQENTRRDKLQKMLQSGDTASKGRVLQEEEEDCHSGEEEEREMTVDKEDTINRSAALKVRMEQRLEAARFRYINQQLYTSTSKAAKRMFKQDPQAFDIYHRGFTAQVQRWPANPVDSIIAYIKRKPATMVVADFGCGDCKIGRSVKNKVHSFDLAPVCNLVTVCDMANVPLPNASVDIAVFCLSLMGTNLGDFLVEANRILVMGGVLKIAEVASRFENVRRFVGALSGLGFKLIAKDTENSYFYSFEFVKTGNPPQNINNTGLELKPCLYKKR